MKFTLALLLAWVCSSNSAVVKPNNQRNYDECLLPTKWRYRRDVRYLYNYVGLTSTGIAGTSDDMAEIKIQAQCEVNPAGICGYNLKVSEVKLLERSSKKEQFKLSKESHKFASALSKYILTFTMTNGRVEKIKSKLEEPSFVTNIKRGILSALQLEFKDNDDTRFMERDISGDCPTRYVKGYEEIRKFKDITECFNRSRIDSIMQLVFYSSNSTRKTLLDTTSSCLYSFDSLSKDIKSVECRETHLFRLFSQKSAGATTTLMQKLTLQSTKEVSNELTLEDSTSRLSDLRFDFDSMSRQQTRIPVDEVYKTFDDLMRINPFKAQSTRSAVLYTQLVYQLRQMNESELNAIWMKYYNCTGVSNHNICEKDKERYQEMLADSFMQCGSEECFLHIMRLNYTLLKQLIPEMARIRKPTETMINRFMDVMMDNDFEVVPPEESITVFGTMIRSFCDNNNKECTVSSNNKYTNFKSWMRFIEQKLKPNIDRGSDKTECEVSPGSVDDVIFIFKAIENIGQMITRQQSLYSRLKHCVRKSKYKSISIAALKALSSIQQDQSLKGFFRDLYENFKLDPGVRMAAYLALMKNPSENDVILALKTLQREVDTQVGSMVWSHLQQMNNSVEPSYGKRVADTIRKASLRFKKQPRVFNTTEKSRFWQKSFFSEKWNLGLSAEGYVLYHHESYFPHSSHLNLTMDILGGAFPLLETNVRGEGFEYILQKNFGLFSQKREYISKASTHSGFASIKFLGKDLALFTPDDMISKLPGSLWVDYLHDLLNKIHELNKGVHKTFTKNVMFAEESLVVPTCLGLPLTMDLNGTAIGNAEVNYKVDLKNLVHNWLWGKTDINGSLSMKPSAIVGMTGRMSIDASHSIAGVQLNGSLFISTELRANINYQNGQPLRFQFNVTEEPREIFKTSSSLIKYVNDKETSVGVKQSCKTVEVCTSSSSFFNTSRYLGLDWCTNVSVPLSWQNKPLPFFPLTGPGYFSMKIYRADPKLTTYRIDVELQRQIDKMFLQFSTPHASFERIVQLNASRSSTMKQNDIQRMNFSIGNKQRNWTTGFYQQASSFKKAMIKFNMTLGQKSFLHMIQISNECDKVAFLSNMSISSEKTGRPITVIFLNGTYGYLNHSINGTFNMTHHSAKFTWQVKVDHSMKKMSTNISCISKCGLVPQSPLLNHNMTINVTYVNTTKYKHMFLSLTLNRTKKLSLLVSKKHMYMKKFTMVVSYFSNITVYKLAMAKKASNLPKTYEDHSLSFNSTWFLNDTDKRVSIIATYKNHSANSNHLIAFHRTMKGDNLKKIICWNGTYANGITQNASHLFNSCLTYLNRTERKSISWFLTAFNTTHTLDARWMNRSSNTSGVQINYKREDKTLANVTALYWKTNKTRSLYIQGKISNWTVDLRHQYLSKGNFKRPYQNRTLLISHKIMNSTHRILNNTFTAIFVNSSQEKSMFLNITLWNETYGIHTFYNKSQDEEPKHVHKIMVYTSKENVLWDIVFQNKTELLNFSSVVRYQNKTVFKHSIFGKRDKSEITYWNTTLDVLEHISFRFKRSGTFKTGMHMESDLTISNETMFWTCFVNKSKISAKFTGWNRTIAFRRTLNYHWISMNLSTWHTIDKEKFNGSLSWMLHRGVKRFEFNISLPNTSFYFTSFSLNSTHFNLSVIRRNRTEFYKEPIIRLLTKDIVQKEFNMTSLKMLWKMANKKTFQLPDKIVKIIMRSISRGVNMAKTGKHLKFMLRNITKVIVTWNYAEQNNLSLMIMNLKNLGKELMKVASTSLPDVTVKYSAYLKNNKVDVVKFLKDLSRALIDLSKSKIDTMAVVDELLWSFGNISDSFNKTAIIVTMTEMIPKTTWHKENLLNITMKVKRKRQEFMSKMKEWGNFAKKIPKTFGEWRLVNTKNAKDVNALLKEYNPRIQNYSMYLMVQIKRYAPLLNDITLTFRNVTYVSEYLIYATYSEVHKKIRSFFKDMKKHITNESCIGGMLYPSLVAIMDTFHVSIFNTTIRNLHEYISRNHLKTMWPILEHPEYIMEHFHQFTSNRNLDELLDIALQQTLKYYNMTIRLPSWYMNRTHDNMVYINDLLVVILNDTVNLMEYNSNKNLTEIVSMYMDHSYNITQKSWDKTKYLLYSDWNQPLHKILEKANITTIFFGGTLKAMPWLKPISRMWNKTAQDVKNMLKNNTVEAQLKKYVPRIINTSLVLSETYANHINSCLNNNSIRTNITFNETRSKVTSFRFSPEIPPNFNKVFLDSYSFYKNVSTFVMDFPKTFYRWFKYLLADFVTKSRYNANKAITDFLARTEKACDETERFVNGSMVDEMLNNLWERPSYDYLWPKIMKFNSIDSNKDFVNWLLQKTFSNEKRISICKVKAYQMAFIINKRQVITFDKKKFHFAKHSRSGCTYIITEDLLKNDFLVLSTPMSYIVRTPKVKIEIFQNGSVRASPPLIIHGQKQEQTDLPIQFEDVYVIREGPVVRVMHRDRWFQFEFDVERSTFSAYISGFYHNRTIGIFGNNNGEMKDDWLSPLGIIETSVEKFFNSWLKGPNLEQCRQVTKQSPFPRCTGAQLKRCRELFELITSPFKSCFASVNPKMFFKACIQAKGCDHFCKGCEPPKEYGKSRAHCDISATYIRACAKEDVLLSMPKVCEICTEEKNQGYKNIDIVFIISEGTRMHQVSNHLKPFVQLLNERLTFYSFEPRYGMVGFSGQPPAHWKGHVHTLNGQFFGSSEEFEKAIKTLKFAPSELHTNISDGYRGIMQATKYPFRPGAAKMFILLTDSPRVGDSDFTSEDVSKAINEIHAHLIIIGDYIFKSDMIGGDTDGLRYYSKSLNGIPKSKNTERLPEADDYVKVMFNTKGAVFRLKTFEKQSRSRAQKLVFEVLSNIVLRFSKCRKPCRQCKTGKFEKAKYSCGKRTPCKPNRKKK